MAAKIAMHTVIFEGNKFSIEEVVDWIIKNESGLFEYQDNADAFEDVGEILRLFCSFIAIKNKDSMCEGRLWDS